MSSLLSRPALNTHFAIKALLFVACMMPLLWLLGQAAVNNLGPDPGKVMVSSTGLWALRLLLLTLSVSPLRAITGLSGLIRFRRMLGLFCWLYATVHLLMVCLHIVGWSWTQLLVESAKRPYMFVGFTAWCLLIPLGLTSNDRAVRWLGARWRVLHRLVYVIGALACLHLIWSVRENYAESLAYLTCFVVLMCHRAVERGGISWVLPWSLKKSSG